MPTAARRRLPPSPAIGECRPGGPPDQAIGEATSLVKLVRTALCDVITADGRAPLLCRSSLPFLAHPSFFHLLSPLLNSIVSLRRVSCCRHPVSRRLSCLWSKEERFWTRYCLRPGIWVSQLQVPVLLRAALRDSLIQALTLERRK